MAFDPSLYEAQRRALLKRFSTSTANSLYDNQIMNQQSQRAIADMNTQFNEAAPNLVAGYGRRGLNSPNIKSGAFAKAMRSFAKKRVEATGDAYGRLDAANAAYQRNLADAQSQFVNDQLDMEAAKARQIAADAAEIMRYRAGAYT